jgi:uncharacterized protein
VKVYDETISTLREAVEKSKIGASDKSNAIKRLSALALRVEESFTPNTFLDDVIKREREDSHLYGGRTVFGKASAPPASGKATQLKLF